MPESKRPMGNREESFIAFPLQYRARLKFCAVPKTDGAPPAALRLIQKRSPIEQLRNQAMSDGMATLLQDGIQKVLAGHTDFKQVRAVCIK